jgi:hypothetical protein
MVRLSTGARRGGRSTYADGCNGGDIDIDGGSMAALGDV